MYFRTFLDHQLITHRLHARLALRTSLNLFVGRVDWRVRWQERFSTSLAPMQWLKSFIWRMYTCTSVIVSHVRQMNAFNPLENRHLPSWVISKTVRRHILEIQPVMSKGIGQDPTEAWKRRQSRFWTIRSAGKRDCKGLTTLFQSPSILRINCPPIPWTANPPALSIPSPFSTLRL